MRGEILDVGTFRSCFDDAPDGFRRETAPHIFLACLLAGRGAGTYHACIGPLINGTLRPHGNWNGADVLSFTNQVGDHPVLLAELKSSSPSLTNSVRRRPHPMSNARIARSVYLADYFPGVLRVRFWTVRQSASFQSELLSVLHL